MGDRSDRVGSVGSIALNVAGVSGTGNAAPSAARLRGRSGSPGRRDGGLRRTDAADPPARRTARDFAAHRFRTAQEPPVGGFTLAGYATRSASARSAMPPAPSATEPASHVSESKPSGGRPPKATTRSWRISAGPPVTTHGNSRAACSERSEGTGLTIGSERQTEVMERFGRNSKPPGSSLAALTGLLGDRNPSGHPSDGMTIPQISTPVDQRDRPRRAAVPPPCLPSRTWSIFLDTRPAPT